MWTNEDNNKSLEEGWGIFNADGVLMIQKYDELDIYQSDDEAIAFLFYKARYENDPLAIKAFKELGVKFNKLPSPTRNKFGG